MDRSSAFGLLIALGGVALGVALEGGQPGAFVSLSSFLIVVVGSLGATVLAFPMHDVSRLGQCVQLLMWGRSYPWEEAIKHLVEIATLARRHGVLSLEKSVDTEEDEMVRSGLRMMVDGADTEIMADVLDARRAAYHHQAKQSEKMFETMGGFMPTMGIVGTVTSLIHVLGNLAEPDKLGAGIAAAFTATLYGVGFANLIVLPAAGRLRCVALEEQEYYKMLQVGLLAVQSGDNPLWVEQKMRAFVPEHVYAAEAAREQDEAVSARPSKRSRRKEAAA